MARLDNNGFVRGTADFRLDPAGHAETGDRTHDAVYGGGRVSDGTDAPAGIALPPGRRWKRIGREGRASRWRATPSPTWPSCRRPPG